MFFAFQPLTFVYGHYLVKKYTSLSLNLLSFLLSSFYFLILSSTPLPTLTFSLIFLSCILPPFSISSLLFPSTQFHSIGVPPTPLRILSSGSKVSRQMQMNSFLVPLERPANSWHLASWFLGIRLLRRSNFRLELCLKHSIVSIPALQWMLGFNVNKERNGYCDSWVFIYILICRFVGARTCLYARASW